MNEGGLDRAEERERALPGAWREPLLMLYYAIADIELLRSGQR